MNAVFDAIIRAAVRNRHLVLVAAAALAAASLWSARGASLDALPSFTPPMVTVQAEAPGLGSTAVERLVTTPLEQALLGTPEMTDMRSTSSPGLSLVQLTFEDGTDVFRARQLVGEAIAGTRERLPSHVPLPRLAPVTASVGALLRFTYTSSDDVTGLRELWQFAEWKLRPRLEAIAGVSGVTVHALGPLADDLLDRIPRRRLDLLALQRAHRSRDEAVRAAVLAQFPALEIGGQVHREVDGVTAAGAELGFELPFFDRNQGEVDRARAERRQVEREYEARLAEARARVYRLLRQLALVEQELEASRAAADAATRLSEQARAAAVAGALSPVVAASAAEDAYESRLRALEVEQSMAELRLALAIYAGADW